MIHSQTRQEDPRSAPCQRLRLRQAVGGLQQLRQVVESEGHVEVVIAVAGLIDRQGTPHQRLRLRQAVGGLQQLSQVVEISGHIGMIGAVAGLIDRQGTAIQGFGVFVSGNLFQEDCLLIE